MIEVFGAVACLLVLVCAVTAVLIVVERGEVQAKAKAKAAAVAEAKAARWEVSTSASMGEVLVTVRRNRDVLIVAKIPNSSSNWEDRVLAAQNEAASRAAILNAEL